MYSNILKLLDSNNDGSISLLELERYLSAVYRAFHSVEADASATDYNYEMVAQQKAKEFLRTAAALNGDDEEQSLTLEEFENLIENNEEFAKLMKMAENVAKDLSWLTIPEMARLTNLWSFSSEELFNKFSVMGNQDPNDVNNNDEITREEFISVVHSIMKLNKEEFQKNRDDALKAEIAIDRIFEAFDTDKSNSVDFIELSIGLTVLAGDSLEEKIRSSFRLYDRDGNGVIDRDEMYNYLLSVYKIQNETNKDLFTTGLLINFFLLLFMDLKISNRLT